MSIATASRIRVEPSGAALGADIVGADLAHPGDDDIASIQARRGACDAAAPPLSALLPPLFERLLV